MTRRKVKQPSEGEWDECFHLHVLGEHIYRYVCRCLCDTRGTRKSARRRGTGRSEAVDPVNPLHHWTSVMQRVP